MPHIVKVVASVVGLASLAYFGLDAFLKKEITLPPYSNVDVQWTSQNWKPEDWKWFYHTPQGGALDLVIPYKWFIALEQPSISFRRQALLSNPAYLGRMGFLSSEKSAYNPDALPVGFARTSNYRNPFTGRPQDVIGLTCAACHTGQIDYKGKGIRIDGGSAMVNLDKLRTAIGLSMLTTYYHPFRFYRFANRVLGEKASDEAREELKKELGYLVTKGQELKNRNTTLNLYPVEEGFGRLDALGRIGNFVFGTELSPANLIPANAPVSFPHIWNTSWFEWVQYNGSIKQPMIRNAGQAMGVFARVDLQGDEHTRFDSTVDVKNLYEIENRLRGPNVFQQGAEPKFRGLNSPKWPEKILGKIDAKRAESGRNLYVQHCQACHLPATDTREFFSDKYWTEADKNGLRSLKVKMVNLAEIGTDSTTATNWYKSVVDLGPLADALKSDVNQRLEPFLGKETGGGMTPAAVALPIIVQKTLEKRFQQLGIPQDKWDDINGNRPNEVRAPLAYMARPLNGVWATPPFLHNGSVHSIYQLLLPASDRDQNFYLGSKEYDPVHLGYDTKPFEGGFMLDTALTGNRNTGHSFSASKEEWAKMVASKNFKPGVIGPELTEKERMDIIEFLKSY